MNNRGILLVVSGPSGSGKGTVIRELMKLRTGLYYSISATTRDPRPGEVDGKNYFFLTQEEFQRQINGGRMLEYARYCGNYYGTPKTAVEEVLERGEDVLLEIEVQGAMKVKEACPDSVTVFLMPPSVRELERRLRGRGTEEEEVVQNRLRTARAEMSAAGNYEYIVVNDQVEAAARRIDAILTAEKLKSERAGFKIEEE